MWHFRSKQNNNIAGFFENEVHTSGRTLFTCHIFNVSSWGNYDQEKVHEFRGWCHCEGSILMSMWLGSTSQDASLIQPTSLKPAGALSNSANAHTHRSTHLREVTGKTHNNLYDMYMSVSQLKSKQQSLLAQGRSCTPTPLINPATSPNGHVTAFCTTYSL